MCQENLETGREESKGWQINTISPPWFNSWEISDSETRLILANQQLWGARCQQEDKGQGFSATSPRSEGKEARVKVKVSCRWGYSGLCAWRKVWFFSYRSSSLKYDTVDPIQKYAKKKRHGEQLQVRTRSPTCDSKRHGLTFRWVIRFFPQLLERIWTISGGGLMRR